MIETGTSGTAPRISVVMIFFNSERFIQEAIASVLAQTYAHWELLLVDDGSSDSSTSIAHEVARDHPNRVRYLEHTGHTNHGMSASRNLGIRNATGDYVMFLDSDDVLTRDALQTAVEIMDRHPEAAMAYGPSEWWYSWNSAAHETDSVHAIPFGGDRIIEPPHVLITSLQQEGYSPAGALFRRSALSSIGGFEESFRGMYEDQALLAKILCRWPVYMSARCWYRYRKNPQGCCANSVVTNTFHNSRRKYLLWLRQYLRAHESIELRRTVREQLLKNRFPQLGRPLDLFNQKTHRLIQILTQFTRRTQ
jgi:glycosyltransferase involved in cell wall biosynthesis